MHRWCWVGRVYLIRRRLNVFPVQGGDFSVGAQAMLTSQTFGCARIVLLAWTTEDAISR